MKVVSHECIEYLGSPEALEDMGIQGPARRESNRGNLSGARIGFCRFRHGYLPNSHRTQSR